MVVGIGKEKATAERRTSNSKALQNARNVVKEWEGYINCIYLQVVAGRQAGVKPIHATMKTVPTNLPKAIKPKSKMQ